MFVILNRLLSIRGEMPSDSSEYVVKALMVRLGEARRATGLTLEQVAERSGVDLGVISRAERGQRIPALASILDWAGALGVNFPEMLGSLLLASEPAEGARKTAVDPAEQVPDIR
jgi:transcriptional regulator with XRE-family HTH domain